MKYDPIKMWASHSIPFPHLPEWKNNGANELKIKSRIKNTKKNKFNCAKLIGFSSFEYTTKLSNSFLFLNQHIAFMTSEIEDPIE